MILLFKLLLQILSIIIGFTLLPLIIIYGILFKPHGEKFSFNDKEVYHGEIQRRIINGVPNRLTYSIYILISIVSGMIMRANDIGYTDSVWTSLVYLFLYLLGIYSFYKLTK